MAARTDPAPATASSDIVDLREISGRRLEPLIAEEARAWSGELDWDFSRSADLVLRFVDMHALSGFALIEHGELAGYTYYVTEENKALIGDLYVRRRFRNAERENRLLGRVLEDVTSAPYTERVESQLMMLDRAARQLPLAKHVSTFARNFMKADLSKAVLPAARPKRPIYLEKWADHYQDASSQLIAAAYVGHVDSLINDQYRSAAGARRFLFNIVQHPGCGTFFRPASYAAFEGETGRLCGISLASLVSERSGHITQICVSPTVRGRGVGFAMLRESLSTLRDLGCATASLTVTAANRNAVELYERVGFRTVKHFSALVWEGF